METMLVAVGGFVLIVVLMMAIPLIVQRGSRSKGEASPAERGWGRQKRNSVALWRVILLAVAYGLAASALQTLTGSATATGTIGLALGLYICAHPAANAVSILFFERDTLSRLSEWSVVRWLALNLLVLLAGWMVIFLGLRRLVDKAALELIR
ncbi:MAG: hypothetical protein PVI07_17440 [Anaerolineae bacterium]|jgi:hypothetical protein